MLSDPNPFPKFRLFGWRKSSPASPRCTGKPCICANGIGCINVPLEMW